MSSSMGEEYDANGGGRVTSGCSRVQHGAFVLPTAEPRAFKSDCVTTVRVVLLKQHWTIENFTTAAALALPGDCLRSRVFRDSAMPDACWQLCLYPGGKRKENANNVSLFLKMDSTSPTREVHIKVEYRLYLLDKMDQPLFRRVNVGEFHAKPPRGGRSWGLRNIPRHKVLNCIREDDSLAIACHIQMCAHMSLTNSRVKDTLVMRTRPVCAGFIQRQAHALANGVMADCNLECNGQTIPVSTFVLCAHSKVFLAMLSQNEVQETRERKIILKNDDVESVKMMLLYMYCGQVDLEGNAKGVLILADRCQMDELKSLCEEKLCAQVDKDNIADMLSLADQFKCQFLKAAVVHVLRSNMAYVLGSQSWRLLKKANPKMIADVMERAMLGSEVTTVSPPSKRQRQHFLSQTTEQEFHRRYVRLMRMLGNGDVP